MNGRRKEEKKVDLCFTIRKGIFHLEGGVGGADGNDKIRLYFILSFFFGQTKETDCGD